MSENKHTPLRVERETQLIVTDDDSATPVLCIAARQPLAVGYQVVHAYNAHQELLEALSRLVDEIGAFTSLDADESLQLKLRDARAAIHKAKATP